METVKEMCGDNRFEVIQRAKEHLIEATNIEQSLDEMKVLDIFLFRAWQMGWLRQYEPTLRNATDKKDGDKSSPSDKWVSVDERLPEESEYLRIGFDARKFYIRFEIAYKTDTIEYAIGYYDGFKWFDERNRFIKNVVGWRILETFPQPPKGVQ